MRQTRLLLACAGLAMTGVGCTPPLQLLPAALPDGAVGVGYSQLLSSDGQGTVAWDVVDGQPPLGLVLGSYSGILVGIPLQAGVYQFTVQAMDSSTPSRLGQVSYTIRVFERLTVDTTLVAGTLNSRYSDTLSASGGLPPYTFKVVGLPAGMSCDAGSGEISGTPVDVIPGDRLDVTVIDSGSPQQTVTARATFVVKGPPVNIVTTSLPDATIGSTTYSATLQASAGLPPYTWNVAPGTSLPAGLELVLSTGEIRVRRSTTTGLPEPIPGTAATSTFTIKVTDSDRPTTTATREFRITVNPAP